MATILSVSSSSLHALPPVLFGECCKYLDSAELLSLWETFDYRIMRLLCASSAFELLSIVYNSDLDSKMLRFWSSTLQMAQIGQLNLSLSNASSLNYQELHSEVLQFFTAKRLVLNNIAFANLLSNSKMRASDSRGPCLFPGTSSLSIDLVEQNDMVSTKNWFELLPPSLTEFSLKVPGWCFDSLHHLPTNLRNITSLTLYAPPPLRSKKTDATAAILLLDLAECLPKLSKLSMLMCPSRSSATLFEVPPTVTDLEILMYTSLSLINWSPNLSKLHLHGLRPQQTPTVRKEDLPLAVIAWELNLRHLRQRCPSVVSFTSELCPTQDIQVLERASEEAARDRFIASFGESLLLKLVPPGADVLSLFDGITRSQSSGTTFARHRLYPNSAAQFEVTSDVLSLCLTLLSAHQDAPLAPYAKHLTSLELIYDPSQLFTSTSLCLKGLPPSLTRLKISSLARVSAQDIEAALPSSLRTVYLPFKNLSAVVACRRKLGQSADIFTLHRKGVPITGNELELVFPSYHAQSTSITYDGFLDALSLVIGKRSFILFLVKPTSWPTSITAVSFDPYRHYTPGNKNKIQDRLLHRLCAYFELEPLLRSSMRQVCVDPKLTGLFSMVALSPSIEVLDVETLPVQSIPANSLLRVLRLHIALVNRVGLLHCKLEELFAPNGVNLPILHLPPTLVRLDIHFPAPTFLEAILGHLPLLKYLKMSAASLRFNASDWPFDSLSEDNLISGLLITAQETHPNLDLQLNEISGLHLDRLKSPLKAADLSFLGGRNRNYKGILPKTLVSLKSLSPYLPFSELEALQDLQHLQMHSTLSSPVSFSKLSPSLNSLILTLGLQQHRTQYIYLNQLPFTERLQVLIAPRCRLGMDPERHLGHSSPLSSNTRPLPQLMVMPNLTHLIISIPAYTDAELFQVIQHYFPKLERIGICSSILLTGVLVQDALLFKVSFESLVTETKRAFQTLLASRYRKRMNRERSSPPSAPCRSVESPHSWLALDSSPSSEAPQTPPPSLITDDTIENDPLNASSGPTPFFYAQFSCDKGHRIDFVLPYSTTHLHLLADPTARRRPKTLKLADLHGSNVASLVENELRSCSESNVVHVAANFSGETIDGLHKLQNLQEVVYSSMQAYVPASYFTHDTLQRLTVTSKLATVALDKLREWVLPPNLAYLELTKLQKSFLFVAEGKKPHPKLSELILPFAIWNHLHPLPPNLKRLEILRFDSIKHSKQLTLDNISLILHEK